VEETIVNNLIPKLKHDIDNQAQNEIGHCHQRQDISSETHGGLEMTSQHEEQMEMTSFRRGTAPPESIKSPNFPIP
jgi:hypothetical protein